MDSKFNLPEWCYATAALAKDGVAELLRALRPENALETGCEVIKHPDCCDLCRKNNDCANIPMHVRCRCLRQPTLMTEKL